MREDQPVTSDTELTLANLLQQQAFQFGEHAAIVARHGGSLSYQQLAEKVEILGKSLADCGVQRGSRVAIVLPNGQDLAVGLLAVSIAAIAVPLSSQYTADEYRSYFELLGVTHVLTLENGTDAVRQTAGQLKLPMIELQNHRNQFRLISHFASDVPQACPSVPCPDDVAVVLMTSGSTGQPKRVPLTHRNLCVAAQHVASSLNLSAQDCCLVMWEQYHIGGLVDLLLAPMASGSRIYCAGSFDASFFFEALEIVRPTWFQGVPTTLRELLRLGELQDYFPLQNSSLRFVRSVAAPLPESLMGGLEDAFQVPVIQTFGMTEAAPLITTNQLPPGIRKPGSTGLPFGCEVAVMDDFGKRVPAGRTGQIAVRGPNIFAGYENDPEANSKCFFDGWFYTGDEGHLDSDGFLYLSGRLKELINRGGEKICPGEIEEVALRHGGVQQATAFSLPHSTLGEDVGLAVVLNEGFQVDSTLLRKQIAQHLSDFKVPSVVMVLEQLPRCPIGKVRRQALAEMAVRQEPLKLRWCDPVSPDIQDDDLARIEQQVAQLWASHLDLLQVDRTVDFRLLGGDSLSQLRLRVAVEALFHVKLSDSDQAAEITTVQAMALQIRNLGGKLSGSNGTQDLKVVDAVRDVLAEVEVGADIADAAPAVIRSRLAECTDPFVFKTTREALLNFLTLDELCGIVPPQTNSIHFTQQLLKLVGSTFALPSARSRCRQEMAVSRAIRKWRNKLRLERKNAAALNWIRTRVESNVYRYRKPERAEQARHLIVGFAGNHMRLMLPTYSILSALEPDCDLLLLADVSRRHFEQGVRGVATNMAGLCRWIRKKVAMWGYQKTTTFGTSAGGLAAIACGYFLQSERIAAVGADAPKTHPQLTQFIQGHVLKGYYPPVVLGYDEQNQRDHDAVSQLTGIIPNSHLLRWEAQGAHNTLQAALGSGQLNSLLKQLLEDGPRCSESDDRFKPVPTRAAS